MATDKRTGGGASGSDGRSRSAATAAGAGAAPAAATSQSAASASPAPINRSVAISPEAKQLSRTLFKRELGDQEYGNLVGAPDGASVNVRVMQDRLRIETKHPLYEGMQVRDIIYNPRTKQMEMDNAYFRLKDNAPAGTGTRVFANQVAAARELGVKAINTYAAGSRFDTEGYNGYYTWPRLGYDAPLRPSYQTMLPASLRGADSLSKLYRTQEGRDWWKQNGEEIGVTFDLRANSVSSRVLNEYLREKGY